MIPRTSRVRAVDAGLIREGVFPDNGPVKRKFQQQFGAEIDACVSSIAETYASIQQRTKSWPRRRQVAVVGAFLQAAGNNLVSALHLLVSGYAMPSGNLMRHFGECVAMALLCSDESLGVFRLFDEQKEEYPVHKSMDRVLQKAVLRRLRRRLAIDEAGWRQSKSLTEFYNHHSRAGAVALAFHFKAEWPHLVILGGEYDRSKRFAYRADLKRCASAARSLGTLAAALDEAILRESGASDPSAG